MGQRISPVHLKILAYTLEVEGHGAQPVLQRCGYASIDDIDEDGDWLPASRLDHMMMAAMAHTGDPAFALVAGKSLALMRYGHMVPLVLSAPHLRAVMADLERYAALVQTTCELLLDEQPPGGARVRIDPLVTQGEGGRFRTEFAVTSALQMLRFASAGPQDVWRIDFPYAEPPGLRARYEAAFGNCLHFSQPGCGVSFQPSLLDRPLPSHDPVAYTAARTRAESALQALQRRSDVAERVHQWLLGQAAVAPSIGDAAQHLGLSERTLRRQLAALGTSYVDLVQQTQRLMAERLLAERHLSIKQVADQLGFSSVSTFHRAFRRWTGQTPTAWQDARRT
ncbi:AraC family transcriptional regulator ligand-binding domain-containing protein [Aquabacterium sp. A3]|uniref:AraC family transcriptional regulator n=1 Tax=Aquabacterium sp. A3 TaxID=3132829 RepID=UPI0031196709